jgi:hypothetical protein
LIIVRLRHAVIAATCVFGCMNQHNGAPKHVLTLPVELCREGLGVQSCRSAEDVEALLAGDLEILDAEAAGGGYQRAYVLTLRSRGPRPVVFRAKWRAHSTTTKRNSPRFELAAYAVQKLFLEPDEYVVPPSVGYCFPIVAYVKRVAHFAKETIERSGCVYGVLSYWLEDVTVVAEANRAGWFHGLYQHVFDPYLFEHDRAYRNSVARVNLLTYLIGHRDSHAKNFVIADSDTAPVAHTVYSVDNSRSFTLAQDPAIKPMHDWSAIHVPSLPRDAIERLRGADLSSLAAIAVLRSTNGRLVAADAGSATAAITGVDWTGDRLVVGLTPPEIATLRARIAELLRRIDQDELALY